MLNEKIILALQSQLDSEYQADKDAIKRVLKLIRKSGIKLDGVKARPATATPGHEGANGSGAEVLVYAEIQKRNGQFTLSDLTTALPDVNRNTISGVLFREKDKTVRVLVKGQGRRAGVYEKM